MNGLHPDKDNGIVGDTSVKLVSREDLEEIDSIDGGDHTTDPAGESIPRERITKKPELQKRGNWTGKLDFLMTMLAYCVGLGNVWRFPYLCFKNGGGAFLLPYMICWTTMAVPMFFLEVAIGQYQQRGGIQLWNICPLFKGVGIATMVMSTYCNIYYCIIVVWAMFYFGSSFQSQLPWMSCGHTWNDERCYEASPDTNTSNASLLDVLDTTTSGMSSMFLPGGVNATSEDDLILSNASARQTPVEQYWERRVLMTTPDIDNFGGMQYELLLILIFTWVLAYFALWKGVTKIKKLIYVCAITPYLLLFVLLIRSVTLPGASSGMYYYLKPNMTKLTETTVWKDAGTQVFYSYGIGFGVLTAMGSYNKFNHNCLKDTFIVCGVNGVTSFIAGFVVFSVLGYMAHVAKKTVAEVVKSGPGLVFLVYPEAVGTLTLPQLWSVLFFLMIIILGMDSQVCNIEGVVTGLSDISPTLRKHKKMFVLAMCLFCFFLGIPFTTKAGQHWLALVDANGASGFTLLFIVFFQVIGFTYGYGVWNLFKSLEDMLGYKPSKIWYYAWRYATPIMITVIFLFITFKYEPLAYSDERPFPVWAQVVGFLITLSSMVCVPIWAVYCLCVQPGTSFMEKFRNSLKAQKHSDLFQQPDTFDDLDDDSYELNSIS